MALSIASAPHCGAPNHRRRHCPSSHLPPPPRPDRRSACLGGNFDYTFEGWGGVPDPPASLAIPSQSLRGVFLLGGPLTPAALLLGLQFILPRLLSCFRWGWGATSLQDHHATPAQSNSVLAKVVALCLLIHGLAAPDLALHFHVSFLVGFLLQGVGDQYVFYLNIFYH